jgi:hypothetical protein
MVVYLLVDATSPSEAVDVFIREEDAVIALAECIADEPSWCDLLSLMALELDPSAHSLN